MMHGFIGRVPVYDRTLNLFGYELRPCMMTDHAGRMEEFFRGLWQSARLEKLTAGRNGLISLPFPLLQHLQDPAWPRHRLILNISQSTFMQLDRAQLQKLRQQGYLLAIDCECFGPELLRDHFAEILAFDAGNPLDPLRPHIGTLHAEGMKLLLRHIETRQQYDQGFSAGFDYFQGRYFEYPRLIHGTHIPANRLAVLRLIARLEDPDVTIEEVESLISQDATLSYKVLRLINSAFHGIPRKVDSIKRAVIFLGLNRIRHWAVVILVNAIEYKPRELLMTALIRAHACERIACALKRGDAEQCYIAGLFSLLDAIMDAPMQEILEHLNLADEINDALLYGSGPIGQVLQTVLCVEHGLCHKIPLREIDPDVLLDAYLEAVEKTETVRQRLETPQD